MGIHALRGEVKSGSFVREPSHSPDSGQWVRMMDNSRGLSIVERVCGNENVPCDSWRTAATL